MSKPTGDVSVLEIEPIKLNDAELRFWKEHHIAMVDFEATLFTRLGIPAELAQGSTATSERALSWKATTARSSSRAHTRDITTGI